jgi:hypothetical protein
MPDAKNEGEDNEAAPSVKAIKKGLSATQLAVKPSRNID